MKKSDFNFIELPKDEIMSSEEQFYLLGGGNCTILDTCQDKYKSNCNPYNDGNCSGEGACGATLYCSDYSCTGKVFV